MLAKSKIQDNQLVDVSSLGPLEKVDCPLCNCDQTKPVAVQKWFGEEFHVVQCTHCKLIFTNPRPTVEWRERFYDPRYNPMIRQRGRDFLYLPKPNRTYVYKRLLEFLKYRVGTGNRLLDAGCAGGQFVKMALDAIVKI